MIKSARFWIEKLQLQKHPEGGWFKEIYRSAEMIPACVLPEGFSGSRNISTSIYFLLEGEDFSTFYRIKSDEIWHFYTGTSAIEIISTTKDLHWWVALLHPDFILMILRWQIRN